MTTVETGNHRRTAPAGARRAAPRRPGNRRRWLAMAAVAAVATVLSLLVVDGTLRPPTGDSAAAAGPSQFTVVNGSIRKASGTPTPPNGTQASLWSNHSVATTTLDGSGRVVIGALGENCKGWPTVSVTADGKVIGELTLTDPANYGAHLVGAALPAGHHTVTITLVNDLYSPPTCDRNAHIGWAGLASDGDLPPLKPGPSAPPSSNAPIPTIGPLPPAPTSAAPSTNPPTPPPAPTNPGPPATGGTPGPGNTGVPVGTKLTVHEGDWTITKAGTVIDSMDIHGFLKIEADNVTVRKSLIRGTYAPGPTGMSLVANYNGHANLVIEDSTLRADKPSAYVDGLKGSNFTARRVDISKVVDTVQILGSNSKIEDSWLHDTAYYTPFAAQSDNQTHNDNVQIEGGSNIVLDNNTMEQAHNAAIMVTQNLGRTSNVQVVGNWLQGGNVCTVNLSEKGKGPITNFSIVQNRFGPALGQNDCAVIAPPSSPVSMVGNVLVNGGAVGVRRGA